MQRRLIAELEQCGFRAKVLSIQHLRELEAELEQLRVTGVLDQGLDQKVVRGFRFDYAQVMPNAKSVIVMASPEPITKLHVIWQGKPERVVIPPTYGLHGDEQALAVVERLLNPAEYSCVRLRLPWKLLAVRSGLAMYGRNNISYIDGLGSFYHLAGLITDLPCTEDNWHEATRMAACDSCGACIANCPTQCIDPERRVIHAENCLTYFNEFIDPFPSWLDSASHNAWIGCMRCQEVCPQNAGCAHVVEVPDAFSEDELQQMASGVELDSLPEKTRQTLQELQLTGDYLSGVLSRNLAVLLDR